MALPLPSETINMNSATSRLWMREWHIPRVLLAVVIQCFSEVMAVLVPLETIERDNATSLL
jgi:hypothetical protein